MKEDLAKIKKVVKDLELNVQLTYNNIVDMPGHADKVNILAMSHATLFTFLQEIHDAKNGERERKKARYAAVYRQETRTPPLADPLALP